MATYIYPSQEFWRRISLCAAVPLLTPRVVFKLGYPCATQNKNNMLLFIKSGPSELGAGQGVQLDSPCPVCWVKHNQKLPCPAISIRNYQEEKKGSGFAERMI